MNIVVPYPNNRKFVSVDEQIQNKEFIRAFQNEVWQYCHNTCSGPWESDMLDVLYNGIRVRIGSEKDLMFLKLKYGATHAY